jgi:hypothetical protein
VLSYDHLADGNKPSLPCLTHLCIELGEMDSAELVPWTLGLLSAVPRDSSDFCTFTIIYRLTASREGLARMVREWDDVTRALDHFSCLRVHLVAIFRWGQPAVAHFAVTWEHMATKYFDRFRARGGLFIHTLRSEVDDLDVLYRLVDRHF